MAKPKKKKTNLMEAFTNVKNVTDAPKVFEGEMPGIVPTLAAVTGAELIEARPAHSHIGASGMHIWSECPASVNAAKGMPEVVSPFAKEGTLAHDIAYQLLTGKITVDQAETLAEMQKLSEDTLPAVLFYVDYVKTRGLKATKVFYEHKFDLSQVHPGLYGTADCVLYFADTKRLVVIDYKNGAGIEVSPHHNPQLLYYGLGAMLSLELPCKTVELVIVQPRVMRRVNGEVYVPPFYELFSHEMVDFSADLQAFAKATEVPNAPFKSGDHCRFCKAAPKCPQLAKEANDLAMKQFTPNKPYDPAQLSIVLQKLPYIRTWLKSVEEFALNEALSGKKVPGFKLVPKRAMRKWTDQKELAKALTHYGLSEDEIYIEPELKTPAQMEKVIRDKSIKEKIYADYCVNVSSGENLVPDDDRRQEVKIEAESQFKAIR